jgi:hypothetical protein
VDEILRSQLRKHWGRKLTKETLPWDPLCDRLHLIFPCQALRFGGGGEEVRGDRWWVVVRRGGEAAGAPPQPWVDGGRWAGLVGLHGDGAEDGVVEDGVEEDSVAR